MSYSLGLTLYTLARRRGAGAARDWPDRPAGPLVWLHAPAAGDVAPLVELARRLIGEDGVAVLLTTQAQAPAVPGLTVFPPPDDTPAAAEAFLGHWAPDVGVLADGALRPVLIHKAHERACPLFLVNARSPAIEDLRGLWLPGLTRGLLGQFRRIMAADEAAARAFRRAGAPAEAIETRGVMEEGSGALPCTEAERAAVARMLHTRPVWLAAGLPPAEDAAVIAAHRAALRLAHRLLLVVVPDDPQRGAALADTMAENPEWIVARRQADEDPEEDAQVYIADTDGELGLWYRVAPVTYLGGSLSSGAQRDPFEPAALGSAIVLGPNAGAFANTFARLREARAAREILTPGELGEAVSDLLAPDRAARLAHAAWTVASAGAEVTDRVIALIRAALDERAA